MIARNRSWRRVFAPVSLGFVLCAAVSARTRPRAEAAEPTASVRRQSATAQYAKAEEQRAALNAKPGEKRTLADYKHVVLSYRRVALITPRAPEVPESLLAVAELYTEMGGHFGRSYYQSAVDSYQFLLREYPKHKSCQDAMLRAAKLQRDQLADLPQAQKTYEEFVKRYPHSPRKREAQEALAELALLGNGTETSAKNTAGEEAVTARKTRPAVTVHSGGKSVEPSSGVEIPRVRRISATASGETTRVTIELENTVHFTSRRITDPDRIFFDLRAARLAPEAARGNIHVEGGLLTAVRVAQNHDGVVRVVLDVNAVKDYSAMLANNPPQLLIDLYGNAPAAVPVETAAAKRGQKAGAGDPPTGDAANRSEQPSPANPKNGTASSASGANTEKNSASGAYTEKNTVASAGNSSPNGVASGRNAKSRALRSAPSNAKPDLIRPASAPLPTHDGQSTLTRTLGLKIGRIVIDPGHGGHDTGTIGPSGLMEKDLCLDVALRLGKIIEQRLPGAEVIYTRSDDTFVPLEERTNIANQAKADLFISIHANSSRDAGARGVETYYLNLKGTAEAMEVAARENATAQEGVHDLEDLVKRITQTEKIDESKEFALDIQDSLAKRIQRSSKSAKNRGVRKAPFVVLIGADMPSILTEISFLSNPADEKMLKQPEQRQKVAEGLYQGISSYLENMNSVTVNLPPKNRAGRPGPGTAAVEQSRNQN
jgi:N-acetylmuramoyl-L-alanine amidase